MNTEIRWITLNDYPQVLAIDRQLETCGAMEYGDLAAFLHERNHHGKVLACGGTVYGFVLYELHPTSIELYRLLALPGCQCRPIQDQLMRCLTRRLGESNRTAVEALVPESNLRGLQFLREQGFRAVHTEPQPFAEIDDDGILMRYDRIPSGGDVWDAVLEGREATT